MFAIILFIFLCVMLLATIIVLGYHDNSDVETVDFQSKVVSAHIESLNNTSHLPGEIYEDADQPSAVNSVQNPPSSDPMLSTYTPRPLSRLPTPSDADQRTLRQKTVGLVKKMSKSSWGDHGRYPGGLDARRRQIRSEVKEFRRKERERNRIIPLERLGPQQRTPEVHV